MIYEFNFKVNEMFDKNSDYDLLMCSVAFAINDLQSVNQMLMKSIEGKKDISDMFCFKLNMGFVREAYELLKFLFNKSEITATRLKKIPDAFEKFKEIDDIINGRLDYKVFKDNMINSNRHWIFHYPKKCDDLKVIHDVIAEIEKDNIDLSLIESEDFMEQKFSFADLIQFNLLYDIYKLPQDDVLVFKELSAVTGKILNLLNIIFVEFVGHKKLNVKIKENDKTSYYDIVGEFINELQLILNLYIPNIDRDIIDTIKLEADQALTNILEKYKLIDSF